MAERYRITARFATATVVVKNARVVSAPPVLKRYLGWLWADVCREMSRRGAMVELLKRSSETSVD